MFPYPIGTSNAPTQSRANSPDGASVVVGGGGPGIVVNGVTWQLGVHGGDRQAEVLRNGAVVGRAARLLHKDGVVFAQDADGGWRRFEGHHHSPVFDVAPHETPSDRAAPEPAAPVCAICGAPEERVMAGRSYCGGHSQYSEPPRAGALLA